MKKKTNIKFINFVKILYTKIINMNIAIFFINLYKIKSNINIIFKFILLLMVLLSKTNEITSIWDLGDLALKMVEQEVKNVKVENVVEGDILSVEASKDIKKEVEEIDFNKMELEEWFDYLREHEPKAYYFWVFAFAGTTIFCVWLMNYLIKPWD